MVSNSVGGGGEDLRLLVLNGIPVRVVVVSLQGPLVVDDLHRGGPVHPRIAVAVVSVSINGLLSAHLSTLFLFYFK